METKGFFRFEIIINVLISSSRFIWIPMLWVYDHYKYVYSYSAGIICRCHILTSKVDPRALRVKLFVICIFLLFEKCAIGDKK